MTQEQSKSSITHLGPQCLEESLEADPYSLFLFAINSPQTKEKYVTRLNKFFDYIGLSAKTIEDRCKEFTNKSKAQANSKYAINSVIRFLQMNKDRVQKKEITGATARNYVKTIKLLCEMNDILLPWKRITKGLPKARRYAEDRAPTIDEIRKIVDYPEQYFTFITPEAYSELEKWMNYRRVAGEEITGESWILRNIWDNKLGARRGIISEPKQLKSIAVKRIMESALWNQGLRKKLQKDKKRHEFQADHGYRKWFKTRCEIVGMKSINIETLMGHSIGISDSYYRVTEQELLDDYLKAVDHLTISKRII
jgi:integrase